VAVAPRAHLQARLGALVSNQTRAFVGVGTSPWHQAHGKRIRFVAEINGGEEIIIGRVKHVSATGALMKVSRELENDKGKPITRMIEYPTAVVKPGSLRELRDGEQA
jgi:hypothetical protein